MMDALDEMRENWSKKFDNSQLYSSPGLFEVIRKRTRLHTRESMKYFWASFTLQIIVYALYTHVIVKYHDDSATVVLGALGIVAYLPFTYTLMRRFKQLAAGRADSVEPSAVHDFIRTKRDILHAFFRFKRRYELLLIPISSLFGTLLVFKLYVPGGPIENVNGVWITMVITLVSCYLAIRKENMKSFRTPLAELDKLLVEFNEG